MTSKNILQQRLHNLRLEGAPFERPEDVVQWLGAVQSQDYGPAKWSVAQRTKGVGDADMDHAFAEGRILRTHVLRPTWHFVRPGDIRWLLQLTGPRVHALNAYAYRRFELNDAVRAKCERLIARALAGGNRLTRDEIETLLKRARITASGFRLAYILMSAELNGVICSGGLRGKKHTYALLDERASPTKPLSHDEALAALTLRYFTSHGPATAKDFKTWASLSAVDVRRGLDLVASKLEHEVVDGVRYHFTGLGSYPRPASSQVHFLQGYDEYVMGYNETKHLIVAAANRASEKGRVVFNHLVILDGHLIGHWKRTLEKDSLVIEAALYRSLSRAQTTAVRIAAERHGAFLGHDARLIISKL